MFSCELADDLCIAGIGVIRHGGLKRKRRPERGGVAIGMKEGQHAEGDIARREVQQLVDRADVRPHILLREHDALRVTSRARREDDGERIIGADPVESQRPFEHSDGKQRRLHKPQTLIEYRGLLP